MKSRTITVTLPYEYYEQLMDIKAKEHRTLSNTAKVMIIRSLNNIREEGR